ncbi:LacI family transcriptional regulator [Veronia nyctiphanis]|uniref:LacI family transcriptional regulator n=1 Tax=Veronia nyctiphanis TaxID=1278244 RepID=A0A4Q0YPC5_9GAMM|nr:LacI family DNA-binding transcriptional regulator [Veronia nyctiphanis]RXJ72870.1 LacI family transcriptional regulator [Veronia nyctiphanis]
MTPRKRLHSGTNKPTLSDVAKAAGVSTASVSRVINNSGPVNPELRAKIEQTILKLGYVRDGAARALASSKTRIVGAIIPTIDNAIFASGISELEKVLYQAGYTLMLSVSNYDLEHEYRQIRDMLEQRVEAVALVGNLHLPESYALLEQHQKLYVNLWTLSETNDHPSVGFDNREAGAKIANYLLNLGHTQFAIISGIRTGNDRAQERVRGVTEALAAEGITIDDADIIECRYGIWEGRHAARHLMRRPDNERPTAVICGNDVLAFGCITECQHLGLNVPEDVSITGVDDLPFSEHLSPALTTLHIPSKTMGQKAAQYILDKLAGNEPENRITVSTQLIARDSTAPLKK